MLKISILLFSFTLASCTGQVINDSNLKNENEDLELKKKNQELIIKEHLENGAWQHMMFSKEWQDNIDNGLKKDSTIAYLWQQKAMPYFKLRKCEIGMPFLDNAVLYDSKRWLAYRGFIKCIFARTYKEAIVDFEECIKKYGNSYEMDHTYSFYIALSYLQLNEFEKAEKILKIDIEDQIKRIKEAHHLDLFYYGISKYEQQKWEEAIIEFDKSLQQYPEFSDVKFFKAICLMRLKKDDEASLLLEKGKIDAEKGYTINEDNAIYEKYPYQVIWQ
ncbi:tetratricopeptide repeat protein [Flavobacterium sp.]|uniref:tetratricopeptide repeat protein n=1 Tax=Flavobacterium sp. TaxID=239 RepID=UPI0040486149